MTFVIGSFTTTIHRAHLLGPFLENLKKEGILDRMHRVYAVLCFPPPPCITDFTHPHFSVLTCDEDHGPIMKLLPHVSSSTTFDDDDTVVVTMDDDVAYTAEMLSGMLIRHAENPSKVLAYSGFHLTADNIYQEWVPMTKVDVVEGYSMALYPVRWFRDGDFLAHVLSHAAYRDSDDVVISTYLHKKNAILLYTTYGPVDRSYALSRVLPYGRIGPHRLSAQNNGTLARYTRFYREMPVNYFRLARKVRT
jgi:hypothetical protein